MAIATRTPGCELNTPPKLVARWRGTTDKETRAAFSAWTCSIGSRCGFPGALDAGMTHAGRGVRVKPVVDVTKVALAGLTAWATMLGLLRARRRARNR